MTFIQQYHGALTLPQNRCYCSSASATKYCKTKNEPIVTVITAVHSLKSVIFEKLTVFIKPNF